MTGNSLPAGYNTYESILSDIHDGKYNFSSIRTASGRRNYLIGITPEQLEIMKSTAKELQIGLILYGSRVSGPRVRQHTLHPVLAQALPLKVAARTSTKKYPGGQNLEIHKTAIKELGIDDPCTSDITLILADLANRTDEEMSQIADIVEERFAKFNNSFPIRVFPVFFGGKFKSEKDFRIFVGNYLNKLLPADHSFSKSEMIAAGRELYTYIGGKPSLFRKSDLFNGLLAGATTSVSFSLVLGFHPVLPVVGFLLGFFGRYLSRYRAYLSEGKSKLAVCRGLAFDWAFGIFLMAGLINPIASYGIVFVNILSGSLLHSLSKGYVRIGIDCIFSKGNYNRQAWGVFLNTISAVLLGVVTSLLYTGSIWAYVIHGCIFVFGMALHNFHLKTAYQAS